MLALLAQAGAISVVDNSILAPVFQQPLSLGADISMTSATKFIGGHADLTAGILSVRGTVLAQRIAFVQVRAPTCMKTGSKQTICSSMPGKSS